MRTHSVWLRLVIVSALRALYRPGGLRTLFLIDEMPALGHLAPLEDAFGLVRGYKVQIAGICQDLAQLKASTRTLGILPRQCGRGARLHAERPDDGGLDVAPRRTDDAGRGKFQRKPPSPRTQQRKHELATGRARALSAL